MYAFTVHRLTTLNVVHSHEALSTVKAVGTSATVRVHLAPCDSLSLPHFPVPGVCLVGRFSTANSVSLIEIRLFRLSVPAQVSFCCLCLLQNLFT